MLAAALSLPRPHFGGALQTPAPRPLPVRRRAAAAPSRAVQRQGAQGARARPGRRGGAAPLPRGPCARRAAPQGPPGPALRGPAPLWADVALTAAALALCGLAEPRVGARAAGDAGRLRRRHRLRGDGPQDGLRREAHAQPLRSTAAGHARGCGSCSTCWIVLPVYDCVGWRADCSATKASPIAQLCMRCRRAHLRRCSAWGMPQLGPGRWN